MCQYHDVIGGYFQCLVNKDGVSISRTVLLSISVQELSMLEKYGDAIFLDVTHIYASLGWNLLPITVLNSNNQIEFAGFISSLSFNKELYIWALDQLFTNTLLLKKSM